LTKSPPGGGGHPRDLAVRILTRVLSDGEPLDEALESVWSAARGQPAQARAWLLEVCSGALRWKGRLDLAIDSVSLKKKPTGWLRKQLLIAAYQLVVQERTAAAPVVSETVSEVKRKEGEAPSKFANAILRKIAEHGKSWRELAHDSKAPSAKAAAWASLPEWLWKAIVADHGAAFAAEFAPACMERPQIWLRSKEPAGRPDWSKYMVEPGPFAGSGKFVSGGKVGDIPGFSSGDFIVQDISSQTLVREIASHVRKALGNESEPTALDLCAAPGGKSVGLAWEGFRVTASDLDGARLKLLEGTEERVKAGIEILPKNQVENLPLQDLVWVDAPCTGSGIIRRHPDVRWLRQPRELASLAKVQLGLIREGWDRVRPGGFFAYSVCSILKEEGAERILEAELGKSSIRVSEWFLPPQNAPYGDGFWAILLRKSDAL
jgi:16S rRNA (cytosine967-C5)-methyltransferase